MNYEFLRILAGVNGKREAENVAAAKSTIRQIDKQVAKAVAENKLRHMGRVNGNGKPRE